MFGNHIVGFPMRRLIYIGKSVTKVYNDRLGAIPPGCAILVRKQRQQFFVRQELFAVPVVTRDIIFKSEQSLFMVQLHTDVSVLKKKKNHKTENGIYLKY